MTVYALFGDDMRLWLTVKTADDIFFGISAAAFVLFFYELLVNSVARPGFANPPSFFFWLDLLATLSLGPDIGWVWEPIETYISGTASPGAGSDISAQIRAGRAARAGTRAGRVVRVVRLIRLVRVFKLYRQWSRAREARRQTKEREADAARQLALEQAHNKLMAKVARAAARAAAGNDATARASGKGRGSTSRKVVPFAGGKPALSGATAETAVVAAGSSRAERRHATVLKPSGDRASAREGARLVSGCSTEHGAIGHGPSTQMHRAGAMLAVAGSRVESPTAQTPTTGTAGGTDDASDRAGDLGSPSRRWSMNSMNSLDYGDESAALSGSGPGHDFLMSQTALDTAIREQAQAEANAASATESSSRNGKISNVGIVLSDLTTRRVIVLILVMLIVVPFLAATQQTASEQIRGGLAELHRYPQDVNVSEEMFEFNVQQYARHAGKIVFLAVCPPDSTGCLHTRSVASIHGILEALRFDSRGDEPRLANGTATADGLTMHPVTGWTSSLLLDTESEVLDKYRGVEVKAYTVDMCYGVDSAGRGADDVDRGLCESIVWTDETEASQEEAFWSFIRTWFVVAIITVGAGLFTRDAELLVIRPIERMAMLMSKLAADPLAEIQALRRLVLQDAYDSDEEDEEEEDEEDDDADNDGGDGEHGKRSHRHRTHGTGTSSSSSEGDDRDFEARGSARRLRNESLVGSEAGVVSVGKGARAGGAHPVPRLPVATVRRTPTGDRSASGPGSRSGSAELSGSRAGLSARRRTSTGGMDEGTTAGGNARSSQRRLSTRTRSAGRNGRRGPELSRYASKRLILADANPVVTSAPMRKLAREGSMRAHAGRKGAKRASDKFGKSRRRIEQAAADEGRAATPGAAGGEPKSTLAEAAARAAGADGTGGKTGTPALAAATTALTAAKKTAVKLKRRKRKADSAASRCAKQSAACLCTSMLNLIGGSAEDASKQAQGSYETAQLENAMLKIGGLLQLGFGEAGADIIGQNMGQSHGKLNPLVPGKRIDAIFGFCDIRRFTDATECLQEEVMVFVNTVGQLVHSCTHRLGGAANKNIGDAFLLTWKLPKLLNPADASLKRRALIHKARGMQAHSRRVSMDAFTSVMDGIPGTPAGGRGLASGPMESQGEWVGHGMFTSAALVPFGGKTKPAPSGVSAAGKPHQASRVHADAPSKQVAGSATGSGLAVDRAATTASHRGTISGSRVQDMVPPAAGAAGARPPVQFHITAEARARPSGRNSISWAEDRPIEEVTAEDEAEDEDNTGTDAVPWGEMHAESLTSSGIGSARRDAGPVGGAAAPASGSADDATAENEADVTADRGDVGAHATGRGGSSPAVPASPSAGAPGSMQAPPARWHSQGSAGLAGASLPESSPETPGSDLPAAMPAATATASATPVMHVQGGRRPPTSATGVHAEGFIATSRAASYGELRSAETGVPASSATEGSRRRASTPSVITRRTRITRPSIVPMNLSKEHQHEEGITIIHDPTAVGGGGSGAEGFAPDGVLGIRDRRATARVADNALAAFLKVIVDIHNANKRHGALYRFRKHKAIRAAFKGDFKVQLGFGLHLGWAVEGAVGSSYKVDASYLSPHVNLASRLEALTKYYGVPLLLSGNFAQELSLDAQRYLRLIDRITVKGSKTPIELYTFDIIHYPPGLGELRENLEPLTEEQREANKMAQETYINIDFASDPNILFLQEDLPDAFFVDFHAGVRAYIRGQWADARMLLTETQARYRPGGDGPTAALLLTMDKLGAETGGLAPADWKGVHILDSKTG